MKLGKELSGFKTERFKRNEGIFMVVLMLLFGMFGGYMAHDTLDFTACKASNFEGQFCKDLQDRCLSSAPDKSICKI